MALFKETARAWANSTTNHTKEKREFNQIIDKIDVTGNVASTAALFCGIFVLCYFRLKSTDISVHRQLFISFFMNNLLWLIWYNIVLDNPSAMESNGIWCISLHVTMYYFMVTSNMWVFCESMNIHHKLVRVFGRRFRGKLLYIFVGWVGPLMLTVTYALVRGFLTTDIDRCWTNWNSALWIIIVPILLSYVCSLVFMADTVRVIIEKLRTAPVHGHFCVVRKTLRAFLILIPFFGLHLLLFPIPFSGNNVFVETYQIVAAVIGSLQGFNLTVIFCFHDKEVIKAFKQHMARRARINEAIELNNLRENAHRSANYITIDVNDDKF